MAARANQLIIPSRSKSTRLSLNARAPINLRVFIGSSEGLGIDLWPNLRSL
jgi:hypothetical protein